MVSALHANAAALSVCALGIALSSVPKIELSHCFWPMVLASLFCSGFAVYSAVNYAVSVIENLKYKLGGVAKELSFAAQKLSYIEARADSGNPRPQDLLRHLVQNFQTFDPQQGGLHIFIEYFVSLKAALFSASWSRAFTQDELKAEFNNFLDAAILSAKELVFYERSQWPEPDEETKAGWRLTLINTQRPELNSMVRFVAERGQCCDLGN